MSLISKATFAAAAALLLLAAPATKSFAASDADCEACFAKMNKDADGGITDHDGGEKIQEAIEHAAHVKPGNVDAITKDEFMTSCKMGDFDQLMKQ